GGESTRTTIRSIDRYSVLRAWLLQAASRSNPRLRSSTMGQRNVIARLMVSVFLIGSIAVRAVLAQGDGPPAPRTFGPDTTAVGSFTGQGTTAPALQCDAPSDPSTARECSGLLDCSVCGTLLDVTVLVSLGAGLLL